MTKALWDKEKKQVTIIDLPEHILKIIDIHKDDPENIHWNLDVSATKKTT